MYLSLCTKLQAFIWKYLNHVFDYFFIEAVQIYSGYVCFYIKAYIPLNSVMFLAGKIYVFL